MQCMAMLTCKACQEGLAGGFTVRAAYMIVMVRSILTQIPSKQSFLLDHVGNNLQRRAAFPDSKTLLFIPIDVLRR